MNWVDLVVLAVILLSGLLAFARGLTREILGVAAWVAAGLIASRYGFFNLAQPLARQYIHDTTVADTVAFVVVFVLALIVLSLLASAIGGLISGSLLGGLDRTLGLLFGFARGAALVCVAYIVVGLAIPVDQWPAPVQGARALPFVYDGAAWVASQVPEPYRPTVAVPPTRATSAADLLQVNPVGHAVRPAAGRE